jgi:hypothetical protein
VKQEDQQANEHGGNLSAADTPMTTRNPRCASINDRTVGVPLDTKPVSAQSKLDLAHEV